MLGEANQDIFAKFLEQVLERGEEAQALARRQVVAQHDLLQLGVTQGIKVEVTRQIAPEPPVGVLDGTLLPGGRCVPSDIAPDIPNCRSWSECYHNAPACCASRRTPPTFLPLLSRSKT